jgi:CDP-diacylglycerol--glycerol-3-phosphate 3-phosphatidyltransferase
MQVALRKQLIPWLMAAGRAALGPVVITSQLLQTNGIAVAAIIIALLSDIFDGVLARRWDCDTPAVRLFDSMADTVLYLCVAIALWIGHRNLLHANAPLLLTLLSMEAARMAFDIGRFGKPTSYHSYLAKAWGLVLASAVIAAFATTHAQIALKAALVLGIVCNLEGFAMSLLLRNWNNDVKTLRAAWHLRQTSDSLSSKQPQRTNIVPASTIAASLE